MTPHICHVFPAFAIGGPEVRTALVINASAGAFRHTIVSLNGDLRGQERLQGAERARCLPAPRHQGRVGHLWGLVRLLHTLRPNLVVTYGWGGVDAVLAAKAAGIRRVVHTEDGFLPDEVPTQKLPRLWARRVVLRGAARLVCPSRTLVRIALATWGLSRSRVRYIPNGVDNARFASEQPDQSRLARRELGLPEDSLVVGTVGVLRPEKNHERLLHAFAAVSASRAVRLLIVGDGPLRARLEQQAGVLGIRNRVYFAGARSDTVVCYQAMDLFALSSDTEQMPLAVLEAMSVGLPVVSTAVGDVRLMVSAANRPFVTESGRDDLYREGLTALLDAEPARIALGQANRQKCRTEYALTTMIEAYVSVYREVLESQCA